MQAHLAATDLACRRGDRLLFSGLSFACEAGEALLVTGPNGVGKSSLMRILAGLLRPFTGHTSQKGSIGLLDEKLALDEDLTLTRALAFWKTLDGAPQAEQSEDPLRLEDLMHIPVRYLSTGQRKRAAIARLLTGNPSIWLLDEPLNGLDDSTRQTVEQMIARHCSGGGIAVIASHQAITLPASQVIALPEYAA